MLQGKKHCEFHTNNQATSLPSFKHMSQDQNWDRYMLCLLSMHLKPGLWFHYYESCLLGKDWMIIG